VLRTGLWIVVGLFPLSEIALAVLKRADPRCAQSEDRGSMRLLWLAIALGVGVAIGCQWVPSARPGLRAELVQALALATLVLGLTVRWVAIVTLGRHFTVNVAIRPDHALVQHGLYRLVRHPSYSGLLVAFVGLGLFFDNWLSLVGLMTPVALAVIHRMATEERSLLAALGPPDAAYCARTKRLFPGVV
jgi:protein-S-isoprenylcysteine O-methyltransferase Ste14